MKNLEDFLNRTETENTGLSQVAKVAQIQYPFIYTESVTDVELRYWKSMGVLQTAPASQDDIAFYWKRGNYKLLGYITLAAMTFKNLSALAQRELWFRKSADTQELVTDNILDLLLLRE